MSIEEDAKPVNVDPRRCVLDPGSTARVDKLTPHSIQEALRMFFQPIKNDDPKLDFYTMYKRETTEYDTEYMQKHNEDLNTTLIFVRFCATFHNNITLTTSVGWSVLRSQLRLRHRRPIEPPARFWPTVRSLPPSDSPHPQSIHCPQRSPHSPSMEWSCQRDRHNLRPPVRESSDVAPGRVCRNVG